MCVPLFLHQSDFVSDIGVIVQLSFIVRPTKTHVLCCFVACDNLDNNSIQLNIIVAVIEIMLCSENW
jgi:hypothetical protein